MTDAPSPRCSSGTAGAIITDIVQHWDELKRDEGAFPVGDRRAAMSEHRLWHAIQTAKAWLKHTEVFHGVAQRPVICGQDTIRTAAKALDYLADHTRPAGGQETYNAEHLIQIAYELREIANASPPAALPAETVTVPLEALRNCGCPADFRATVGQCEDSGQCGCSINLKGRAVSSTPICSSRVTSTHEKSHG